MEGEGFLASGRSTPFRPKHEALREQAKLARAGNATGLVPQTERAIAKHAVDLLDSDAFQTVMGELVDSARATFENAPLGEAGNDRRSIAHAQILACHAIIEKLRAMADDAKIHDRIEAEQSEHD
jgi:hypothetical protein